MKINAVRLFLLTVGLFLLFFTGSSMAEITYNFDILPPDPYVNSLVTANAYSTWADDDVNNYGSMTFRWSQSNSKEQFRYSDTVNYLYGDIDYSSSYIIPESGTWYIYYEEFDDIYGGGESIGGGGPNDRTTFTATLPEFSSYIFMMISLLSIYFISRKKIVS